MQVSEKTDAYEIDIATVICEQISQGATINEACDAGKIGKSTWFRWLNSLPDLWEMYARARETRAHARFERLDEVVAQMRRKEIDPQMARVEMDAIKWMCGKENARHYADKQTVEVSGPDGRPVATGLTLEFLAPLALAAAEHVAASRPAEPILSPITYDHEPQPTDSIEP